MPLPPAMPARGRRAGRAAARSGPAAASPRACRRRAAGVQPVRETPPGTRRTPTPARVAGAGADRIGAAQVLAVDLFAQRQVLARLKRKVLAQLGGTSKRRPAPRRCRAGPRTRSGWNADGSWCVVQIGLKCSKGSRQARQRYSALQAVAPRRTAARCRRCRSAGRPRRAARPAGAAGRAAGAAARCRRRAAFARPSSLIQSVVQAGRRRCVDRTPGQPGVARASRTCRSITSVAGQPL